MIVDYVASFDRDDVSVQASDAPEPFSSVEIIARCNYEESSLFAEGFLV